MRRTLLVLFLTCFSLVCCQSSEREKIQRVLDQREEALRKKDLSLYLSCISKTYQDEEGDFSGLRKRMEGYFINFDRIDYASWDRSIQIEKKTARVTQQFHMEVRKGGKKNRHSGREALLLHKEGEEWKIVRGL